MNTPVSDKGSDISYMGGGGGGGGGGGEVPSRYLRSNPMLRHASGSSPSLDQNAVARADSGNGSTSSGSRNGSRKHKRGVRKGEGIMRVMMVGVRGYYIMSKEGNMGHCKTT